MTDCLSASTIAAFIATGGQGLGPDKFRKAQLHLSECGECQAAYRRGRLWHSKQSETQDNVLRRDHTDRKQVDDTTQVVPPGASLEDLIPPQYELQGQLGRGGMGQVYLVADRQTGEKLALKFCSPMKELEVDDLRRFRREGYVSSELSHPNVVKTIHVGNNNGTWYIVSEYVEGETLLDYVTRRRAIPWTDAVVFVQQVARGLKYIHDAGYVHRDIKPSNLMLTFTEGKPNVKILDMGLIRPFGDDSSSDDNAEVTVEGGYVGSPHYFPPERMSGENSPRGDIYSLGCTLHFLFTGKVVFAEYASRQEVLQAHASQEVPGLVQSNPGVPSALNDLYLRMSAKNPENRVQTADDVIRGIDDAVTQASRGRRLTTKAAIAAAVTMSLLCAYYVWNTTRAVRTGLSENPAVRFGRGGSPGRSSARQLGTATLRVEPPTPERRSPKGLDIVAVNDGIASFENSLQMEFVRVPPNELSGIKPFWVCIYETTQANYAMSANADRLIDGRESEALWPVVGVDARAAESYCDRLSALPDEAAAGRKYRLLTAAEWQHVSVAETTTDFSWGNDHLKVGEYAWWAKNSGDRRHQVGMKLPNPLGVYDLQGNVLEWTSSKGKFEDRILGGSWYGSVAYNTFKPRYIGTRNRRTKADHIGFRVACDVKPTAGPPSADTSDLP